jgi:hypothetical protein
MKSKLAAFILVILLLCIGSVIGKLYLEKIHLRLSQEAIDICNMGPGLENEVERAERFWKKVKEINDKVEIAVFFARQRSSIGYGFLSSIIGKLTFCGNTEYTFSKAYETLGYLGRFDQRAADLLISEFKPEEDPTRAIDILRALIISENRTAILKIKDMALRRLGGYLSDEEKGKLL